MSESNYIYIASLVRQTQAGNNNAFAELYALTCQQQYQYAKKYLRDEYLAQDALQEIYILALENIRQLQEPRVFLAWLKQINFRVCYSMMQKARKHTASNLDETPEHDYLYPDMARSAEDEVLHTIENERLVHSLSLLPERERMAIILRYSRNMKLEEISESMGTSLSTVKRLINRACNHLQEILGKE